MRVILNYGKDMSIKGVFNYVFLQCLSVLKIWRPLFHFKLKARTQTFIPELCKDMLLQTVVLCWIWRIFKHLVMKAKVVPVICPLKVSIPFTPNRNRFNAKLRLSKATLNQWRRMGVIITFFIFYWFILKEEWLDYVLWNLTTPLIFRLKQNILFQSELLFLPYHPHWIIF